MLKLIDSSKPKDLLKSQIPSERLVLVPISLEYKEEMFKEFTPEITRYMFPRPAADISETEEFINASIAKMKNEEEIVCAIIMNETREFLGCCGLHGEAGSTNPTLGIWLKASAHGQGYGLEAISALRDWAEKNVSFDYLTYPVDHRNTSSTRIPTLLGGEVAGQKKVMNLSGNILEEVIYHIPRKQVRSAA